MSKHAGQDLGPLWEDVYDYVNRLQIMWSCTVVLKMRLYRSGKPERLHGACVAEASKAPGPLDGALGYGTHGFKGQSGAKTAPGAFWHALSDLEGKLAGVEKVRQDRLPL